MNQSVYCISNAIFKELIILHKSKFLIELNYLFASTEDICLNFILANSLIRINEQKFS
jgi:hypothetical protein